MAQTSPGVDRDKIRKQWVGFANTHGREAYEDLMKYIDAQREMYRRYAEERAMPNPNDPSHLLALDNETVAALLQNSRGLNMIRTYIQGHVNAEDVAPKKPK